MNERIQEIANQAFDTAEYPADQQYRIEPNPAFCKKFAELIVKECAIHLHRRGVEGFGILEERNLKEHFGVEE